jgi:hypothetical protein
MNIKKRQSINEDLLKALRAGHISHHTPFEYDILPDGTRVLTNRGFILTTLKNSKLIKDAQEEHHDLWEGQLVARKRRNGVVVNEWHSEADMAIITRLQEQGVTPDMVRTLPSLCDGIAEVRQQRRHIDKKTSMSSKLQEYKNSWNSMSPDEVMQKVLPQGTAIGIELEYHAKAHVQGEDEDGNPTYDTGRMNFEYPNNSEELYGCSWGYDSSVTMDGDPTLFHRGQEVRIMLQYGKWSRLHKLCKFLREHQAQLSYKCGLHVHLDTRNLSSSARDTRGARFQAALPWLLKLVPKSRRDNTYCKPVYSTTEKYSAFTSHARYRKSIECRLHSGSLNPYKIIKWVELLWFLKEQYKPITTLRQFLASPAEPELKEWVMRRYYELNATDLNEGDDPYEILSEVQTEPRTRR